MKLCSRLNSFWLNFCDKRQLGYRSEPILGKLGVTHDRVWWLVGKAMVNFLFALIELFSLSITVSELWGEMRRPTARLFSKGVDLCALKFYLDRLSPSNHFWHQKARDTGLPDGEDRIPLRFLVLTQYRSVTDRRTDRRIAFAYTAACIAARCKKTPSYLPANAVYSIQPYCKYVQFLVYYNHWRFYSLTAWLHCLYLESLPVRRQVRL